MENWGKLLKFGNTETFSGNQSLFFQRLDIFLVCLFLKQIIHSILNLLWIIYKSYKQYHKLIMTFYLKFSKKITLGYLSKFSLLKNCFYLWFPKKIVFPINNPLRIPQILNSIPSTYHIFIGNNFMENSHFKIWNFLSYRDIFYIFIKKFSLLIFILFIY